MSESRINGGQEICPVLPQDMFIDNILVRMSVKSVGRSRCVSKPWRSLLSSPQFLKAHFKFHLHNPPENLLILSDHFDANICISTLATDGGNDVVSDGVSRDVTVPHVESFKGNMVLVEGSCHGLVLLSRRSCTLFKVLLNPTTLESEKITNLRYGYFHTSGLGYDSSNDDFKVVLISRKDEYVRNRTYSVDVYSVKAKVWKKAANSKYNFCNHSEGNSGMFLNGCIHWLAYKPDNVIAAFSLAREEFETVNPPRGVLNLCDSTTTLSVLGGCLTLVVESSDGGGADVWMMKEYGVQDSWMKFDISFPDVVFPRYCIKKKQKLVCPLGDDEILVLKHSNYKQLAAYNLRNGSWRNLVIAGLPHHFFGHARTFTRSLVSPNYNRE